MNAIRAGLAALLLVVASSAASGCKSKKNTELMIAVTTDVRVPKDLNAVTIRVVSFGAVQFEETYEVGPGGLKLPATIGVVPKDADDLKPVDIEIIGRFSTGGDPAQATTRVVRKARVTFAKEIVALMRMPLRFSCFDNDCPTPGESCQAGVCKPTEEVQGSTLPVFTHEQVFGSGSAGAVDACFDAVTCLATARTMIATGGDGCTYAVEGTESEALTVALRVPGASNYGFCNGTECKVPLDRDANEGWDYVDASKSAVRLAQGICAKAKARGWTAVATASCGTKTIDRPLCDAFEPGPPPMEAGTPEVGEDTSIRDSGAPDMTVVLDSAPPVFEASDECGVASYGTVASATWAKGYGDKGDDDFNDVAQDSSGNIFAGGAMQGSFMIGTSSLTSAGGTDALLAKFDSAGTPLWAVRFGGLGEDNIVMLSVDAAGDVAVAGFFEKSFVIGTTTLTPILARDAYVAKFASDGTFRWAKSFPSYADTAVVAAKDGSVVVSGNFTGTFDFGGGSLTAAGSYDIFLAKYSATGAYVWAKQYGSADDDDIPAMQTIDSTGNIILSGYFKGDVNLGGSTLKSVGDYDIFVAKYSPTGIHDWSFRLGGTGADKAWTTGVDAADDIYVSGEFTGTTDLGTGPLISAGDQDVYTMKISPSGAVLWAKRFGGPGKEGLFLQAVDPAGGVVLSGDFTGAIDFGGGSLAACGERAFLAKLSSTGSHVWSRRMGTIGGFNPVHIRGTTMVAAGGFSGTASMGGATLTSKGSKDTYLMRFPMP